MKKQRQTPDVYQLTKKVLTKGTIKYPELALYESLLRHNAERYGKINGCEHVYDRTFGTSVIPECYNDEYHKGLTCTFYEKESGAILHKRGCNLKHQLYLHDIILIKWKLEANGTKVSIRIDCVPKVMYVTDGVACKEENSTVNQELPHAFEIKLLQLVNKFAKDGLDKPTLVHKLEYVLQSSKMS